MFCPPHPWTPCPLLQPVDPIIKGLEHKQQLQESKNSAKEQRRAPKRRKTQRQKANPASEAAPAPGRPRLRRESQPASAASKNLLQRRHRETPPSGGTLVKKAPPRSKQRRGKQTGNSPGRAGGGKKNQRRQGSMLNGGVTSSATNRQETAGAKSNAQAERRAIKSRPRAAGGGTEDVGASSVSQTPKSTIAISRHKIDTPDRSEEGEPYVSSSTLSRRPQRARPARNKKEKDSSLDPKAQDGPIQAPTSPISTSSGKVKKSTAHAKPTPSPSEDPHNRAAKGVASPAEQAAANGEQSIQHESESRATQRPATSKAAARGTLLPEADQGRGSASMDKSSRSRETSKGSKKRKGGAITDNVLVEDLADGWPQLTTGAQHSFEPSSILANNIIDPSHTRPTAVVDEAPRAPQSLTGEFETGAALQVTASAAGGLQLDSPDPSDPWEAQEEEKFTGLGSSWREAQVFQDLEDDVQVPQDAEDGYGNLMYFEDGLPPYLISEDYDDELVDDDSTTGDSSWNLEGVPQTLLPATPDEVSEQVRMEKTTLDSPDKGFEFHLDGATAYDPESLLQTR